MNRARKQKAPVDEAISKEEETILWRSLESVPLLYREPLILFYREGQSVEARRAGSGHFRRRGEATPLARSQIIARAGHRIR